MRGGGCERGAGGRGIGLDSRIGPKFLRPGIGYGGSCFPKDVAAFRSVAEQMGVDFNLLSEVEKINVQSEEALPGQGALGAVDAARQALAVLGSGVQGRHGRHSRVARDRPGRDAAGARAVPSWPTIRRRWSGPRQELPAIRSCAMRRCYDAAAMRMRC